MIEENATVPKTVPENFGFRDILRPLSRSDCLEGKYNKINCLEWGSKTVSRRVSRSTPFYGTHLPPPRRGQKCPVGLQGRNTLGQGAYSSASTLRLQLRPRRRCDPQMWPRGKTAASPSGGPSSHMHTAPRNRAQASPLRHDCPGAVPKIGHRSPSYGAAHEPIVDRSIPISDSPPRPWPKWLKSAILEFAQVAKRRACHLRSTRNQAFLRLSAGPRVNAPLFSPANLRT